MMSGADPRLLLKQMISADSDIPEDIDQISLWKIILSLLSEPPRREKLSAVNTLEDVVGLIRRSSKIIILTGAGVRKEQSQSHGIFFQNLPSFDESAGNFPTPSEAATVGFPGTFKAQDELAG